MQHNFGYWLAGLIDGEGTFYIGLAGKGLAPRFHLGLVATDRPVLEEIVGETGIGRLYDVPRRPPRQPFVIWKAVDKRDYLTLVALLDRYPLRTKKAAEYAVWREAVMLWAPVKYFTDMPRLAELKEALRPSAG